MSLTHFERRREKRKGKLLDELPLRGKDEADTEKEASAFKPDKDKTETTTGKKGNMTSLSIVLKKTLEGNSDGIKSQPEDSIKEHEGTTVAKLPDAPEQHRLVKIGMEWVANERRILEEVRAGATKMKGTLYFTRIYQLRRIATAAKDVKLLEKVVEGIKENRVAATEKAIHKHLDLYIATMPVIQKNGTIVHWTWSFFNHMRLQNRLLAPSTAGVETLYQGEDMEKDFAEEKPKYLRYITWKVADRK